MELYVYYRVNPGHLPALLRAATELHAALCTDMPGLTARLLQRADSVPSEPGGAAANRQGLQTPADLTVMEVYYRRSAPLDAHQLDDIDAQAQAAFAPWTVGERHRERFIDRVSTPPA